MYTEFAHFLRHISKEKALLKDGELWTAVVIGGATTVWLSRSPHRMAHVQAQLGDLLTVASIIFGFVLTTLVFYIQATNEWSKDDAVRRVASKLIDWHVLSIITLLTMIGYTLALLLITPYLSGITEAVAFGVLAFLAVYSAGQILNHALTIWWAFQRRDRLRTESQQDNVKR